jgi:hypothetical protein
MLDCRQLIKTVRFDIFSLKLSSSFTEPPTPKEPEVVKSAAAAKSEGGKKDGTKKCLNKFTKNASRCPDFKLKEGKIWATSFGNKVINKRVIWNNKGKICPRWHIHGHYFENCVNANGHIKASKIPAKKIPKSRNSWKQFMSLIEELDTLGCDLPNPNNENGNFIPMTNTKSQLT